MRLMSRNRTELWIGKGMFALFIYFVLFAAVNAQKPGVYKEEWPRYIAKSTTWNELIIKKNQHFVYNHYECFGAFSYSGRYFIQKSNMYFVIDPWPVEAHFVNLITLDSQLMGQIKFRRKEYNQNLDSCKVILSYGEKSDTLVTDHAGVINISLPKRDSTKYKLDILNIGMSSFTITGSEEAKKWFEFLDGTKKGDTLLFMKVKRLGRNELVFKEKGKTVRFHRKRLKSAGHRLGGLFHRRED